jgi:hypothetical protein
MTASSRVYFIKPVGMDGPIKIGCSALPEKRLADLMAWSPLPLEVIGSVAGTINDEQFLHGCFAHIHSHREWFHSSLPLRNMISEIIAAGSIAPARAAMKPTGSIRKGGRKNWTPDQRKQSSYGHRIRWALNKLRREDETEIVYATVPDEVRAIMTKWHGNPYRGRPGPPATDAEVARLEAFLANPSGQVHLSCIPRIRPKSGAAA